MDRKTARESTTQCSGLVKQRLITEVYVYSMIIYFQTLGLDQKESFESVDKLSMVISTTTDCQRRGYGFKISAAHSVSPIISIEEKASLLVMAHLSLKALLLTQVSRLRPDAETI